MISARCEAADESDAEFPGDADATRALRAAILGFFACPPLLHLYSAWVLLRMDSSSGALSPWGRRKYYLAWAIDLVVVAAACLLLREGVQR